MLNTNELQVLMAWTGDYNGLAKIKTLTVGEEYFKKLIATSQPTEMELGR